MKSRRRETPRAWRGDRFAAAAVVGVAAASVALACGETPSGGQSSAAAPLENGNVARVGPSVISADAVRLTAAALGLSPPAALGLLLDDAVGAEGARSAGLERSPNVALAAKAALARREALALHDEAKKAGPPTQTELDELTRVRWREVDLPEQVQVIHAVVTRQAPDAARDDARAALAETLRNAVESASDAAQFELRARSVPTGGREIKVETLPPFVADGRASSPGNESSFDATFVAAAFALREPGVTSPVVETPFGWHVIRLLQRLPSKQLTNAERTAYFAPDVFAARAKKAIDAALADLRKRTPVEVNGAAEQLMAEVAQSAP